MWDTADFMNVCKRFRVHEGQEVITGSVKIGNNYIKVEVQRRGGAKLNTQKIE